MTQSSRRTTIVRGAVAVAFVAMGLAGLSVSAASRPAAGVTVERTFLPTVTPPGYGTGSRNIYAEHLALAAEPVASVLYGIDELNPGFVTAYDLATLRPRSHQGLVLDGAVSAFTQLPDGGGLLTAVSAAGQEQPTTEIERVAWSGGRLRVLSRLATPAGALGPAQTVVGFGLDSRHDRAFVLSTTLVRGAEATGSLQLSAPGSVQLSLVRLGTGSRGAELLWHQPLPDCQLPMVIGKATPLRLPAPMGVVHSGRVLDVGCAAQGSDGIYKPPTPIGVGAVRLTGGAEPRYAGFELFPYPGDTAGMPEGLWFPREDRMVFQTYNVDNGGGWVVFDGDHDTYVGAVPLRQNALAVGADVDHGRLYLLTGLANEGLRTADVGPTPVDQGHTYPQYNVDRVNEDQNYGQGPMQVPVVTDPSHRRVFILYELSHKFVVLHDSVAYYKTPTPPDPDQNTTNIAERHGVTDANWSGSAQGYGSVVRQVGGASNLQYNYAPLVVNASQSGTQQLATSYLAALQLNGGDARASAVTAAPDDGPTTADLAQVGVQWPYRPAVCDDSGATKAAKVDSAEVACDSSRGSVKAAVVGGAAGSGSTPQSSAVVVSSTALTAKSTAAVGEGMSTTVTSVARGISILGGQLQIGHIAATATVHAGGRPGTARSAYSRTVTNVVLAGQHLCAHSCDPKDLATRINDALAGRVMVAFPDPDRQLAAGSPGGYQSLIRRNTFDQTQETQLNDQDPDRAEVPAMEVTVFEDNTIKSRTVVYLAGVEAEAHYGIYRLSCATCSTGTAPNNQPADQAGSAPTKPTSISSVPATQVSTAPQPQVASQPNSVAGLLRHGWQLLVNGIGAVIRLFGVWLLLLAPVYLSARRWLLLSRHRQAR